jgi:hypothetical protein
MPEIEILHERIAVEDLRRLVLDGFGDMVKYVVDLERGVLAVGGASSMPTLKRCWSAPEVGRRISRGANHHPGTSPEKCIEFTSLINICPAGSNPGMELEDPGLRECVRALTFALIGQGEAL